MRLFWMAWSFAVLLVLMATGGTAWVFAVSDGWPGLVRVTSRALCLIGSFAAFVGAFRLALLATASLRFVLAKNLAAVIALELDGLRRAAQERATALTGDTSPARAVHLDAWRASETLQIPHFFGERGEIRKLLGPATEYTLEQLLASLQSYNRAVATAKSQKAGGNAGPLLWQEIVGVQNSLKRAAHEIAPFCLAT